MFANKWQQLSKQTGGVLRYDNFPYNIVLKPSVPDVNSGCISGARYFLKYKHKSTGHMEKGTSWEIPPHIVSVQKISNSTSLFKITLPPTPTHYISYIGYQQATSTFFSDTPFSAYVQLSLEISSHGIKFTENFLL